MRIGSMVVAAVLAFGVGLALRGWSGQSGAVAPKAASPLDSARTSRPIKLVRADPGALHRPARDGRSEARGAPAAPVPPLAAPSAPVALRPRAPAYKPSSAPEVQSFGLPEQPSSGDNTFDSEE